VQPRLVSSVADHLVLPGRKPSLSSVRLSNL